MLIVRWRKEGISNRKETSYLPLHIYFLWATQHNQHTSILIFGLMLMLSHRETHITHKGTDKLAWTKRWSNSIPPNWGNTASSQLSNTFVSCHRNCVKWIQSQWRHWTTDNPFECACFNFNTCVNFELHPGSGDMHICWLNFDALAQGNANLQTPYQSTHINKHICYTYVICPHCDMDVIFENINDDFLCVVYFLAKKKCFGHKSCYTQT